VGDGQLRLRFGRQFERMEDCSACDLTDAEMIDASISVHDAACPQIEDIVGRLQHFRCNREHFLTQLPARGPSHFACDGGPARRPRTTAMRRRCGVAKRNADPIRREPHGVGDNLREALLNALADFGCRGLRPDIAAGL
jgi:hypothetical protein